jgi:hypothetical protein
MDSRRRPAAHAGRGQLNKQINKLTSVPIARRLAGRPRGSPNNMARKAIVSIVSRALWWWGRALDDTASGSMDNRPLAERTCKLAAAERTSRIRARPG